MFGNTPSYVWFDVSKLPLEYITIRYWGYTEYTENRSWVASLLAVETALVAAAGKLRSKHAIIPCKCQIWLFKCILLSNHAMQAKVVPIKFQG